MIRLYAAWCANLLLAFTIPFADGQTIAEKFDGPSNSFSKPVLVGGVEFDVAAAASWERPADVYGEFKPNILLRITNQSDKDLTFDLGDHVRISLATACGPELVRGPIGKLHFDKPVRVAAGKSETVNLPLRLVHTRIDWVSLGAKGDLVSSTNWLSDDILPGKYNLSVSLESSRMDEDAWQGKMRTKTLEVEVRGSE